MELMSGKMDPEDNDPGPHLEFSAILFFFLQNESVRDKERERE